MSDNILEYDWPRQESVSGYSIPLSDVKPHGVGADEIQNRWEKAKSDLLKKIS
jgi:hypothetical protein